MDTRTAFKELIEQKSLFMQLKNSSGGAMTEVNFRQIRRRAEAGELRESQMEDLLQQAGWKKKITWSKK